MAKGGVLLLLAMEGWRRGLRFHREELWELQLQLPSSSSSVWVQVEVEVPLDSAGGA